MAEGNFVTKNARSEVKEFATEMLIEIAFLLSVFPIRIASSITSSEKNRTTLLQQSPNLPFQLR